MSRFDVGYGIYGDYRMDGGPGSGNWGHAGVKGQLGGSAPRSSKDSLKTLRGLANGFYTKLEDLQDDLKEEGFDVLEINREYVVIDDDQSDNDAQYEIRLHGTERTITFAEDDVSVISVFDNDEDDDDDEDDDEW